MPTSGSRLQDVADRAGDLPALRPRHPRPHRDLQELHPLQTSRQEDGKVLLFQHNAIQTTIIFLFSLVD